MCINNFLARGIDLCFVCCGLCAYHFNKVPKDIGYFLFCIHSLLEVWHALSTETLLVCRIIMCRLCCQIIRTNHYVYCTERMPSISGIYSGCLSTGDPLISIVHAWHVVVAHVDNLHNFIPTSVVMDSIYSYVIYVVIICLLCIIYSYVLYVIINYACVYLFYVGVISSPTVVPTCDSLACGRLAYK